MGTVTNCQQKKKYMIDPSRKHRPWTIYIHAYGFSLAQYLCKHSHVYRRMEHHQHHFYVLCPSRSWIICNTIILHFDRENHLESKMQEYKKIMQAWLWSWPNTTMDSHREKQYNFLFWENRFLTWQIIVHYMHGKRSTNCINQWVPC